MSVDSVDSLLNALRLSNLLSAGQMADLERDLVASDRELLPQQLAQLLVRQKLLTRWQAQMLLAGRHAFFLGKYKLVDRLGQGGMGAVFRAVHMTLGRTVAIKVMAPGLVKTPGAVARFQREIQAAAALDHPNIVAAYDADSVQDTHFLVMECVEGRDLNYWANQKQVLPIGWTCECIRQAALGLQHAHERGMAHRDIKPANLLVTKAADGNGPLVKVLDMGLARFVSESSVDGGLTQTGVVMGTPDYIAPEQAASTKRADIRSDIFSLGCTLYRLLAGHLPFQGDTVMEKLMARTTDAPSIREARRDVPSELAAVIARMLARAPEARYQAPLEVATALAPFAVLPAAGGVPTPVLALPLTDSIPISQVITQDEIRSAANPTLDKFLTHVATEFDSSAQTSETGSFVSAPGDATEADFRRTPAIGGNPALGRLERRKASERRRFLLTGTILGIALLLGAAWLAWVQTGGTRLTVEWQPAERKGGTLQLDGREIQLSASGSLIFRGQAGRRRIRMTRAGFEPIEVDVTLGRGEEKSISADWKPTPATARSREWTALKKRTLAEFAAFGAQPPTAEDARVLSLKKRLREFRLRWPMTDEGVGAAKLASKLPSRLDRLQFADVPESERFEFQPAELVGVLGEHRGWHGGMIAPVCFSPDGTLVASSSGNAAGVPAVRLWDPRTMDPRGEIKGLAKAWTFTKDGSRLLVSGWNDVRFHEVIAPENEGTIVISDLPATIGTVALSPDEKIIAVSTENSMLRVFDLEGTIATPREAVKAHPDLAPISIAFTPDGQTIITGSHDMTLKLWNLRDKGPPVLRATLAKHRDWISDLSVSPDGRTLASVGTWDFELRLWDLTSQEPKEAATLPLGAATCSVRFSNDGRMLAVGLWNGTVLLFDPAKNPPTLTASLAAHDAMVFALAFSADDKQLVTGASDGAVRIWDLSGAEPKERVFRDSGHLRAITGIAIGPDEDWIASAGLDGRLIFWDVANGKERQRITHDQGIAALDLSPDGSTLSIADGSGIIGIRDVSSADRNRFPVRVSGWPSSARMSPDQRWLGCTDGTAVRLWDLKTGAEQPRLGAHARALSCFTFTPDGRTVISADKTREYEAPEPSRIKFWEVATGKQQLELKSGSSTVDAIEVAPDGKTMAAGSSGSPLEIWNLSRRTKIPTASNSTVIAWSPDGGQMATIYDYPPGASNMTIVLRDPTTGKELKSFDLLSSPRKVVFSPDCRHLIIGNGNGVVYILRLNRFDWGARSE